MMSDERYPFLHRNYEAYDKFIVRQSINGYNESETLQELKKSGLKFNKLYDKDSYRYGVLANFLTKYNTLLHQIKNAIPYMCFIEDDVVVQKHFPQTVESLLNNFDNDPELNIIRLGEWGECYITSLESAKRIVSLIKEAGICDNIDNQLRKHCGREKYINLRKVHGFEFVFQLQTSTNEGDCLKTPKIDLKKIDNELYLKHVDILNYKKNKNEEEVLYFSQNGTDKYLQDNLFKGRKNGFFIDVGATNGINSNNTLSLERFFNWSGLLIEPSLNYKNLIKNRGDNHKNYLSHHFLSDVDDEDILFGHKHSGCFGADSRALSDNEADDWRWVEENEFEIISQQSKTLSTLLNDMCPFVFEVDFLSVSANGHELEVLKGINFMTHGIRSILIKSDDPKVLNFLEEKGFKKLQKISKYFLFIQSGLEDFFKIPDSGLPKWKNLW